MNTTRTINPTKTGMIFTLAVCLMLGMGGKAKSQAPLETAPYYFLAIHNEPWHEPTHTHGGEERIATEFEVLEEIVAKADAYNFSLTLMFSPQWSDYIVDNNKLEQVQEWQSNGHEIGIHHHRINHGNWDGYTDYPEDEAIAQRTAKKGAGNEETYLGTLDDYMAKVNRLNPDINSGCSNTGNDVQSIPDAIIYDTCSGFANFGEMHRLSDIEPEKGRNDYILSYELGGVQRYWLTHYQIFRGVDEAETAFNSLNGDQAYGVVAHSVAADAENLFEFMEFLHVADPEGLNSRTLAEIAEQALLPINSVATPRQTGPARSNISGRCGDNICDAVETANPQLCPKDC